MDLGQWDSERRKQLSPDITSGEAGATAIRPAGALPARPDVSGNVLSWGTTSVLPSPPPTLSPSSACSDSPILYPPPALPLSSLHLGNLSPTVPLVPLHLSPAPSQASESQKQGHKDKKKKLLPLPHPHGLTMTMGGEMKP